jgi:hypothetical protein
MTDISLLTKLAQQHSDSGDKRVAIQLLNIADQLKRSAHYSRAMMSNLEECSLCHDAFAIRDMTFSGMQFLCKKCKR